MTIRIIDDEIGIRKNYLGSGYTVYGIDDDLPLAGTDTEAEALAAKRAFEQVLLPRFTRDEAIAIVTERIARDATAMDRALGSERRKGARLALEALAAAGVFVDGDVIVRDLSGNGNDLVAPTMADKLDAAGIR